MATSAWARSDSSTWPKRWALAVPSSLTSAPRRCSSARTSLRTSSRRVSMTSFFAARSACTPRRRRPELLAVEHRRLLQGELHRRVAVGRGPRRDLGHGVLDRRVDLVGDGRRRPATRRPAPSPPARWRPPRGRRQEHVQDDHAAMMRGGCHSERGWRVLQPRRWTTAPCDPGRAPAPRRCCSRSSASSCCPTAGRSGRRPSCRRSACSTSRSATPGRRSPASPSRARCARRSRAGGPAGT